MHSPMGQHNIDSGVTWLQIRALDFKIVIEQSSSHRMQRCGTDVTKWQNHLATAMILSNLLCKRA
jgi:hypothetical protein